MVLAIISIVLLHCMGAMGAIILIDVEDGYVDDFDYIICILIGPFAFLWQAIKYYNNKEERLCVLCDSKKQYKFSICKKCYMSNGCPSELEAKYLKKKKYIDNNLEEEEIERRLKKYKEIKEQIRKETNLDGEID